MLKFLIKKPEIIWIIQILNIYKAKLCPKNIFVTGYKITSYLINNKLLNSNKKLLSLI